LPKVTSYVVFGVREASSLKEALEGVVVASVFSIMGHHRVKVAIMCGSDKKVVRKLSERLNPGVFGTGVLANSSFNHGEELSD